MRHIFIDPPYPVLEGNQLFSLDDPVLNRDDQLLYFHRLKESIIGVNDSIETADYLVDLKGLDAAEYYSFGNYSRFLKIDSNVKFRAFILMEPPSAFPYIIRHCLKFLSTLSFYMFTT
jgi:hypothetical protein